MPLDESDKVTNSKGHSDGHPTPLENLASGEDQKEMTEKDQKTEPGTNCLGRCLYKFRLELVSYLLMFSWVLIRVSSTSMILDKVCLVHYNYSETICSNLDNYTSIKQEVEKTATNYQLGHSLITTAPAALISCFIGPWSDIYSRKVPILLAITGMFLGTVGSTVCAYFLHTRVEYYYIPAIFTGSLGGIVTFLTIIYSYASDMTPEALRTLKYAFVSMAVGLSQPLGAGIGGWIYKFWGYPAVFMISALGLALSFISVIFFLPETRGQENNDPLKTKLKNLFTLDTLKEGFIATVKPRPNQGRKQILLLLMAMCFIFVAINSSGDINYFFAHHQYSWDNTTYSTNIAIYSVIYVVLLVVVVPALKYIRAGDPLLGLSGTVSIFLKYLGIGIAWNVIVYHIANVSGCLEACAALAGRSRISKVVPNEDIGKIFSLVATAESLLPVLTTVLISQAFRAFLDFYPAMPYLILACCLIPPLGVFGWLTRMPNKSDAYVNIDKGSNGEAPGNIKA